MSALALAVVLWPTPADAHLNSTGLGPLYDGAVHFFTSPVDLLSALALALFAGLRARQHGRRVLFALPGAWLLGGIVGASAPPVAESAIVSALSVIGLGVLLALDAKLSLRATTVLAVAVGLHHGFLNGSGLGWSPSSCVALIGLAATVFALAALASALAVALQAGWTRIGVRVVGSWIAASGLLWLGWAARSSR